MSSPNRDAARRDPRRAFGFTRRQWFLGRIEYHVRHFVWKVRHAKR